MYYPSFQAKLHYQQNNELGIDWYNNNNYNDNDKDNNNDKGEPLVVTGYTNGHGAAVGGLVPSLTKNMNGFDITPEYLSVVYRATAEDRCALIDYLSKVHPGRMTSETPNTGMTQENLRLQPPVATVGAIGSGDNDVKML